MDEPIAIGAGCGADPSFGATSRGMGALTLKMNSIARLLSCLFPAPRLGSVARRGGRSHCVESVPASKQQEQHQPQQSSTTRGVLCGSKAGTAPKSFVQERTAREG